MFSSYRTPNISENISMKRNMISTIRIKKCGSKIAFSKFHQRASPAAPEKAPKQRLISYVGSIKSPT